MGNKHALSTGVTRRTLRPIRTERAHWSMRASLISSSGNSVSKPPAPTNLPRWLITWLRKNLMFVPRHVVWLPLTSGTRSGRRAQAFREPLLRGPGMPFFLSMDCRNQILSHGTSWS